MAEETPGSSIQHARSHSGRVDLAVAMTALALMACAGAGEPDLSNAVPCLLQSEVVLDYKLDSTITFSYPSLFYYSMDSRGELYATSSSGGEILHWSADGAMLPVIGSKGEGPGEFVGSNVLPFIGPGDTLYARADGVHWQIFGPDQHFIRKASMGPISASPLSTVHFLPDGRVLSGSQRPDELFTLLVLDRDGTVLQRIGPIDSSAARLYPDRAVVGVSDGSFWVGPPMTEGRGYWVERYDQSGSAVGIIRRDVPWFVADSVFQPDRSGRKDRPFLFPRVQQLGVDHEDNLWVVTVVPKLPRNQAKRLTQSAGSPGELEERSMMALERHLEVFENGTDRLLASGVFPFGFHLMSDPSVGIMVTDDSITGVRQVTRVNLSLAAPDGAGCGVGVTSSDLQE